MEAEVEENTDRIPKNCVTFLLKPESLRPYEAGVVEHQSKIDGLQKVTDAKELEQKIATSSSELEMLIEIVSNLHIDDATQRTEIIDHISEIFSRLNATRSRLRNKQQELGRTEEALEHYRRVLDLWQDCEPEHQRQVDEVRQRVEGLSGA